MICRVSKTGGNYLIRSGMSIDISSELEKLWIVIEVYYNLIINSLKCLIKDLLMPTLPIALRA